MVQGFLGELVVGLLEHVVVQPLDGGNLLKKSRHIGEPFPPGHFRKGGIGGGEFFQLAGCGEGQIWGGVAQGEGVACVDLNVLLRLRRMLLNHLQKFLSMHLFIVCRFQKDARQILLAFFSGDIGVNGVPVSGLGFAGKCPGQIDAGF